MVVPADNYQERQRSNSALLVCESSKKRAEPKRVCCDSRSDTTFVSVQAMSIEQLTRFYENHHTERAKVGTSFIASKQRVSYLREWVGSGHEVLDVGCRDGALSSHYLEGNHVTGIDVDRQALKLAAAKGIATMYADLNVPLPLEDDSFDVAVAGEVLEHVMFPPNTVSEIARVLRPEGTLLGSVPNGYRFQNRRRFLLGRDIDAGPFDEHLHIFSWWGLETLLRQHFEDVTVLAVGGKVLGPWKVGPRTPRRLSLFFGRDLVFRGTRLKKSAGNG